MSAIGQTGTVPASPSGDSSAQVPPSTGQPADQTQQQGQPQTDGFWGRFPTVPEDQRAALEPHLKTVQGYVTRLEQNYVAPFRGYTPQQVQGLAQFAKAFDANPLQTFLAIGQQLQSQGVIHEDLDLEMLAAIAQGQEIPDDDEPTDPEGAPPADGTGDPWDQAPPWAQEMRSWFQAQQQREQEQARVTRERQENAVLDRAITSVQQKLEEAGFPKDKIGKDQIQASFIVHKGNVEAVLNSFTNLRTGLLQGVVPNQENDDTVDLPRGVPGNGLTATQRRAKADPGDSFKKASAGAEQMLRASLRSAQSG